MDDICSNCKTKQEAMNLVTVYKNNFKQIALDTIQTEGYNYDVNIYYKKE